MSVISIDKLKLRQHPQKQMTDTVKSAWTFSRQHLSLAFFVSFINLLYRLWTKICNDILHLKRKANGPRSFEEMKVDRAWQNWFGNKKTFIEGYFEPENVEEVILIVKKANELNQRIRIIGGGYSWSPVVEPSKGGWMMCLKRMKKVLEINKDSKTIKTQPGISVADLTKIAQDHGLEIQSPTVFNFPTVGGIMATAAHGTGNTTRTFSDYVISFSIVDGFGILHTNVTTEDELRAAGCNLGCLGVIVDIVLQCVDFSRVKRIDRKLDAHTFCKRIPGLLKEQEFTEVFWYPLAEYAMALAGSRTDEPESTHINYKLRDLLRRGLNAIYNYIWGFACRTCNQKILKILWKPASFIFPVTERVENSRCLFHYHPWGAAVWNMELSVDLERSGEALCYLMERIRKLKDQEKYPADQALHARFIDASNTFLGHSSGRQSCCIDIVASKYNPEFREFFVEIEQEMMDKFDARPHWGKIFIDSKKMYDKYDPESIRKFLAVREKFDPNRTFLNEFLEDWFRLPPLKDQTSDEIEEISIIAEASVKSTLDLNKSKYVELLSDGSGMEPSLPQYSMHKHSRENMLAKTREAYQYEHHYYHNKCVGIPKKFPRTKHFAVSIKYVGKALRSLARGTAKYYWRYLTWHKASTGSGYAPLNDFGRNAPLPGPTSYCNDRVFGWQRLSGLDPMSLRRIAKLDQVPTNVNQAITNNILMQQLNRRTDLETEVNNGNVFFVDYTIFNQIGHAIQRGEVKKDEKQFIAAPYCLMIFDDETLVPVAIEINSIVFTPVQGERWELAKFFVQVAAVNHHGLCAHEYGQHAMIGAFSVATPRHLHKEHPIYVLLEPHLNFSIAHTAFSSAEMRFNTQIPFMTPSKDQMKKLVEVAYEKWTFTDLDFDFSLTDRGVEQYPKVYPYRDDGKLIWITLAKFVTDYICSFYKSNNDVKQDWELQNWISELQSHDGGNIQGLIWKDKKTLDNRRDLVRLLTRIIFLAGPHHAVIHFSQLDFFSDALNLMSGCSMISCESIMDSLTAETTSKSGSSTTLLKKAMPTPYLAMKQAMTFEYGNIHYDQLGDYKHFSLDKVDQIRPFVREFQDSLKQIEKIIEDRAQKRFLPNSYLKPSAIPNSTNV